MALGADYPTAHMVISESIPAEIRGRLVLGACSFQALGAVMATAIAALFLTLESSLDLWRQLYLLPIIPVILVAWGRLFLPESSHWLMSKGRVEHAEVQLRRLLHRKDIQLAAVKIKDDTQVHHGDGWRQLFRGQTKRATILASVPWFLQDLSTYGIGIFTPVIIAAAFGAEDHTQSMAAVINNALLGAKGTALVDIGFLIGISVAILLADRWGRIPLQIVGFIGCALGLLIATMGSLGSGMNLPVIVAGFFLFQFMTNLGPNAQTYLLAGEVFPIRVRGLGAGFAAAAGKVGAVTLDSAGAFGTTATWEKSLSDASACVKVFNANSVYVGSNGQILKLRMTDGFQSGTYGLSGATGPVSTIAMDSYASIFYVQTNSSSLWGVPIF